MDEKDPHKNPIDTIDEAPTKKANYDHMKWIALDNLSTASVLVKSCRLEKALNHVQIAQSALKEMYVDKETPLVKHILSGVNYIQSLLYGTKDSQNAADHASRIGGMLEVIVIIMRG